jgi:hypothetical protein
MNNSRRRPGAEAALLLAALCGCGSSPRRPIDASPAAVEAGAHRAADGRAEATPAIDASVPDAPVPDGPVSDAAAPDAAGEAAPPASINGVRVGPGEILTNRYDNARTGANLGEEVLTASNVGDLDLLGSWPVDGEIYAQVLVVEGIEHASGTKNLALVATMQNSVYAFDLDAPESQAPLWRAGMGQLGRPGFSARNVGGLNGILSTPVVDKGRQALYLVARDCDPSFPPESPRCEHRLYELDLRSGAILRTTTIAGASPPATFEPSAHWNRPALLSAQGNLYIAFGSGPAADQHEEDFVYHGWLFRYALEDLTRPTGVYCTTPRGRGGSVWQAGAGPAADGERVYFTGANGIMDYRVHPPADWPAAPVGQEDSVIRLPLAGAFPAAGEPVSQFFDSRPYQAGGNVFQFMESGDNGFGSSGPMLIPGTDLLLVGTKAGLVYLLDRKTMAAVGDPLVPFQSLPLQPGHTMYLHSWWGIPVITQAFVFWRPDEQGAPGRYGYAYAWASEDKLKSLRFDYQTNRIEALATADVPALGGGANLVLSARGGDPASGVLWAASRSTTAAAPVGHLWAFDPLTLRPLWRGDTPAWSKFTPPTVVRGRILLPSTSNRDTAPRQVLVYGLRSAPRN